MCSFHWATVICLGTFSHLGKIKVRKCVCGTHCSLLENGVTSQDQNLGATRLGLPTGMYILDTEHCYSIHHTFLLTVKGNVAKREMMPD